MAITKIFDYRFILFFPILFFSCYSFKGISIDPNVNTFFVENLRVTAQNAPPNIAVEFTERIKDKVRNETRLVLKTEEPDVVFTGEVSNYRVAVLAPKPNEQVSLNKLEITLKLTYTNTKNEKKGWKDRTFQHFAEFSSDTDLYAVQDQLIRTIGDQLMEDIFNAAFNDW